jgi:hypothetical protein
VLFDQYERPLESETMRPANESCERCHWPPAFHGDTVREIKRYLTDERSSEERTYLILKTGGGERERGLGRGIHWHIENRVEYVATDEHKQDIRWVRSQLPDGQTVEYNDVLDPLSAEQLDQAKVRVMDCVDCHNRVGHPFPYPEQASDNAIAEGRISTELPYLKKEMLDLLSAAHPSQEAALSAVDVVETRYRETHPDVAATHDSEIDQAAQVTKELLMRLVFEEPGVTWRSFPDNGRHSEFAGCFRCHDGKHLSPEGESIRLHCNICHSVPVVVGLGERPPEMPVTYIQEPESHLQANYMADHRFQADDSCVECHGEVEFGSDDSSFCANSACHGRQWPSVELDAAFPHPVALEGKHAEAWCHNCHSGVAKPEYRCSNCHQPPALAHFGEDCEQCHTPAGFGLVNLEAFQHPVRLTGQHAESDCMACHRGDQQPVFECASCHTPPEGHLELSCDSCHSPEGWHEIASSLVGPLPEYPHSLEGTDQCLLCHLPPQLPTAGPVNHESWSQEQCTLCHQVAP